MKHPFPPTADVARLIERVACAARFQGKTGKAKTSTEAFALILARAFRAGFTQHRPRRPQMPAFLDLAPTELALAEEPRKHINPSRIFHRSSTLNKDTFSV